MVYIGRSKGCAQVRIQEVGFSIHILSMEGLDSNDPKYELLMANINASFAVNVDKDLKEITNSAERIMTERIRASATLIHFLLQTSFWSKIYFNLTPFSTPKLGND
ncbi:hypothetical protein IGI04_022744 [Brassica rapa subsp. trilocularis]|uniref:Uncharacterized protein n=1 Tax=Brassica rapa subsp. trilocularis TaxID=1813537 RepID=A0ABQ7M612_BRACM|nr:hypothetical protein IGI04_022744 [Brassica rapa subsp. trilocularis]